MKEQVMNDQTYIINLEQRLKHWYSCDEDECLECADIERILTILDKYDLT